MPPATDTVAAVDGSRLRADIGHDPRWRATFENARLVVLEHIEGGRVTETVSRASDGKVHYSNPRARRTLRITVTREEEVASFDPSIWRP